MKRGIMDHYIIRKMLPSMFTLGNLLCGFLAILTVVRESGSSSFVTAAWWIIIAGVFDALDGKIARLAGSSSKFGVELDSLADVVSFGIAPAVLFYTFTLKSAGSLGYFLGFCFLACGALRLARFNITATTSEKNYFKGMPIPAGAGILASFVLFSEKVWGGLAHSDFSVVLIILTSLMMVSTFKYNVLPKISFKTKKASIISVWFICHIAVIVLSVLACREFSPS